MWNSVTFVSAVKLKLSHSHLQFIGCLLWEKTKTAFKWTPWGYVWWNDAQILVETKVCWSNYAKDKKCFFGNYWGDVCYGTVLGLHATMATRMIFKDPRHFDWINTRKCVAHSNVFFESMWPWKSHFLKTMVPFPVPPCLQPQVSSKEAMTLCLSCAERSLSSWPSRSLEVSSKLRTILVSRPRASRSSFKFFDICVLASWKHYMAEWKMNIGFNEGLRDAIFQLCPDCLAKSLVSTFYESMIAIACTCKLQALQALIRIHRNECMCTLIYIYTHL